MLKKNEDFESLSNRRRDELIDSLLDDYGIYMLDQEVPYDKAERYMFHYHKELERMEDEDLLFLEMEGIFGFKYLYNKFSMDKQKG